MTGRALSWRYAVAALVAVVAIGIAVLALTGAEAGRLAAAALLVQPLVLASILIPAARLVFLAGHDVKFATAFEAVSLTQALLQVLPSRLSEGVRPFYLRARAGLPLDRGIAVLLFERLLDVVCVVALLILATGSAAGAASGLDHVSASLWILAGLGTAGIAVLLFAPGVMDKALALLPQGKLTVWIERLVTAARLSAEPSRLLPAVGLSALTWGASFAVFAAFFAFAGSLPLSLAQWLVVFLASTIGLAVAVAPGGLGTFEAAVVVPLNLFGYSVAEATGLALGFRIANNLIPAIIALWLMARGRFDITDLKRMLRKGGGTAGDKTGGDPT